MGPEIFFPSQQPQIWSIVCRYSRTEEPALSFDALSFISSQIFKETGTFVAEGS
jgi:hypothetical protein